MDDERGGDLARRRTLGSGVEKTNLSSTLERAKARDEKRNKGGLSRAWASSAYSGRSYVNRDREEYSSFWPKLAKG